MKEKNTAVTIRFFPQRFLFVLPIILMEAEFTHSLTGAIFGVVLAFFTGRMFPLVEHGIATPAPIKKEK